MNRIVVNCSSDEDIRLSKKTAKNLKKSVDEIDNTPVNSDIDAVREGKKWMHYNNNVPGRFATQNVL
ncbi:hypothetical protein TNCV_68861 [Trichonephila clavipes]|nr:hypothetical protein TNCV_68861 [Trichonephila clavipes]